jgi:hypothetical protein
MLMTIAAKVLKTGEFFQATAIIEDDGVQRDTHRPLQSTKHYRGSLFPGTRVGNSKNIEYSEVNLLINVQGLLEGKRLRKLALKARLSPRLGGGRLSKVLACCKTDLLNQGGE